MKEDSIDNMTKEQFMKRLRQRDHSIIDILVDKGFNIVSSKFVKFLICDVFELKSLETLVEREGFTTKRESYGGRPDQFYSDILDDKGKSIGNISNQGLPSIELYNSKYKESLATSLSVYDNIIEPIKGVHRVLNWHTTDGKFHILANDYIILNAMPVEVSEEEVNNFLEKTEINPYMFENNKK